MSDPTTIKAAAEAVTFAVPIIIRDQKSLIDYALMVLPAIIGLLGVLIGGLISFWFNRKGRFEEQSIKLNLHKYEKINKLWDRYTLAYNIISGTPNFVTGWNSINLQNYTQHILWLLLVDTKKQISDSYLEVNYLMSDELGGLCEYMNHLMTDELFNFGNMPKNIDPSKYSPLVTELDKMLGLMMSLLKLECNYDLLNGVLYNRHDKCLKAIKSFKIRTNDYLATKKEEFDRVNKFLETRRPSVNTKPNVSP